MSTKLRIATFNLENFDDQPGEQPSLQTRIALMRPQLIRLDADILCLQEINGQEKSGQRQLLALEQLLEKTPYSNFHRATTQTNNGQVYQQRNQVILSRFEISEYRQYKNEFIPPLLYRQITAQPTETIAKEISWERPILHAKVNLPENRVLDVINVHLKSKLPTTINGQKINNYIWKTASGWAEGSFISAMKRAGQAMEARILIDRLFDANEDALIAICGDFNSEADEVPIEAIRGDVENTGNAELAKRVMLPCEQSIPQSSRFSLLHQGQGVMLDHIMVSRSLLAYYKRVEIHNELLHDESISFATDKLYPESDHAPVVAEFTLLDTEVAV